MMTRRQTIKSKLVLKDLGNPKRIASEPETTRSITLGSIYGQVWGTEDKTAPTGEVFVGFKGAFQGVPLDPAQPIIMSDTMYLPPGPYGLLMERVKTLEPGDTVEFAMDVEVHRATNPQ